MRRWLALLIALSLPACALAVTEGVVESAPGIELELGFLGDQTQESFLPRPRQVQEEAGWMLSQAYDPQMGEGGNYDRMTSMCRLTSGEACRANLLLEAYERGEAKGNAEHVLNVQNDVVVGVYPLEEKDYDGESVLLLLPGTMLSDEQILDIIDAYAVLGLRFDPQALNERNCVRGETFWRHDTPEERERSSNIRKEIERGTLPMQAIDTSSIRTVTVNMRYFLGSYGPDDRFIFTPFRRMTDEELAARLVCIGIKGIDADTLMLERSARHMLAGEQDYPLSMELVSIQDVGIYSAQHETLQEDGRKSWMLPRKVVLTFTWKDEQGKTVYLDVAVDRHSGELLEHTIRNP